VVRWIIVMSVLGGALALALPARAQDTENERRPTRTFTPVHLEHEIRDAERGVVRSRYRISDVPSSEAPEVAARRHLQRFRADYGIHASTSDLRVVRTRETSFSRHVTFEQVVGDIPVFARSVHVSMDLDGRPTMVMSGYEPGLADFVLPNPALTPTSAASAAERHAGHPLTLVRAPRLVIYPDARPVVAYHLIARPLDDHTEWSIVVDALDGSIIEWVSTATHAHTAKRSFSGESATRHESFNVTSTAAVDVVDGIGYVFDPDPLTTAGVEYGLPYVNADDADIPELNAERFQRPLLDITRSIDGLYRLEGPYVTIVGGDVIGAAYTPPSPTVPEFFYTRGNSFFEAVNAYYHIDSSQRYAQTLGIEVHQYPVRVNPHGLGAADDSNYLPNSNAIQFGRGGIDDAEDAEVVWHEYAHALLESASPGLLSSSEGRALHEGWADYWAVSYTRELIESGAVPQRDWRKFATWDGNETWNGRYLNHMGTYPEDAPCSRGAACNIYEDGRLWATTLMEIWSELGRETTDRLNLASHAYLSPPVTMRDAAEAIIQADEDLHGGAHALVLSDIFSRRGFVDLAVPLPVIAHTPPPSTEDVGGTLPIRIDLTTHGVDVSTVRVVYSIDGATDDDVGLEELSPGQFEGRIQLGTGAGEVRYYIEVVDELTRSVRHPSAAPAQRISILYGPDSDPPTISHEAPGIVNILEWPFRVSAVITDRMGIESAWVEYVVDGEDTGEFTLSAQDSVFTGRFPDFDVEVGSVVQYRIRARDAAQAGNLAVLPGEGWLSVTITGGTLIREFDLDAATDHGVAATGVWERSEPSYGVTFAHKGRQVWGTRPNRRYPSSAGASTLTLPAVNLSAAGNPQLVFWHWFDTEHDGAATGPRPDMNARLWDGGNVKLSVNGGQSWHVAMPAEGYTATIASGYSNPLGGQPGFGGHSMGWRQVVVPLPSESQVHIRFEFGTDDGNTGPSLGYAGWYIDAISIRTAPPVDDIAPEILSTPSPNLRAGHLGTLPFVTVSATDDVGVESVRIPYEVMSASGSVVERDTVFLAMQPWDRTVFEGRMSTSTSLEPGWTIRYGVEVRDFGRNVASAPSTHRIDVVYEENRSILSGAHAYGVWERIVDRWTTSADATGDPVSSLLLTPTDLPSNAETMVLAVRHSHVFGECSGGNLKISTDSGRSWVVLEPIGGYDTVLGTDHPMREQPSFAGSHNGMRESLFDLTSFTGEQVRVRFDVAGDASHWTVVGANLRVLAEGTDLETPRRYALQTPYPNPVENSATIEYSLESQQTVLLEVYDVLGRRIHVLVWAVRPAGAHTVTYDARNLPAGSYILTMTTESGRLSRPFVRLK
jgi:hypothetical protein